MSDVAEKRIEAFASAARTATATSNLISIPGDATSIGIAMETTAYTSGNFTAKIQHSLSGDQWEDLAGATTGAISATGLKTATSTATALPLLRVVLTGATTPVATQSVYIIYG
jgi:hypothetical protein